MDNAANISPCQVVAQLNAICNSGTWSIPVLNASFTYDNPTVVNRTVSLCTCSWASYNLISACTACQQGDLGYKIAEWSVYSSECNGKLSNSYFPANITIPQDTTIPFWAGTNPTTWPNGKFDVSSAQTTANEHHKDLTNSVTAPKKSKNIGAIVGGVIGGLVVIGAAIAVAFYILRRQTKPVQPGSSHSLGEKPAHGRSFSDLTTNSNNPYTTLSSTPMHPPTSPTILTHNTSVRSVPFFSSVAASTVPYGTASPPPVPRQAVSPPPANREDFIEPFTLPPSNNGDRKQANGAYPVYDPPSAPPQNTVRMDITRPVTPSQRARYNPPAYTESSPGASASGQNSRPPHRGKQASTDTLQSVTSSRNHGTRPTTDHSPNSSASGMANIVGQMGVANPPQNNQGSGSTMPQGHGRQVSGSRDEKVRPTEESFSARDIA